jgi:hypothetical protein
MNTRMPEYLCDPADGSDLQLSAETVIINGRVERAISFRLAVAPRGH